MASLGASSVTVPGMATADLSTASSWNCTSNCPQEEIVTEDVNLPDGADYERDGSVSVHWKQSYWSSDKGAYVHIFSVSGGAGSTTTWLGGEIYGQRYRLETSQGDLQPSTQGNRHGQYPCDDEDEFIPSWAQPLMEAAIGTIHVGASWFLAVDEALRESMGHRPDGFDLFAGGFEYGDMATSLTSPRPWGQCGFFHRVELESSYYSPSVDIEMGFSHHDSAGATLWRELEGTVDFFSTGDEPEFSTSSAATAHPEELSDEVWKEYGIKDVRDAPVTAQSADSEVSVDYLVTKSPLSMDEFEVTEKSEAEMDDPYSERYREVPGRSDTPGRGTSRSKRYQ